MEHEPYVIKDGLYLIDGKEEFYVNGSVLYAKDTDGALFWYKDSQLHKEDGPAVIIPGDNTYCAWYIKGKYHREDGPAVEYADGYREWYLNGRLMTEEEFNTKLNK